MLLSLLMVRPFPEIIKGFTEVVQTAKTFINQVSGTPQITTGEDASKVSDAIREVSPLSESCSYQLLFANRAPRVAKATLNILIGKVGIVPIAGAPVAMMLRSIKNMIDVRAVALEMNA